MYEVMRNLELLKKAQTHYTIVAEVMSDSGIRDRIVADIECLNKAYGEDRDLDTDLGGYIVLVWGCPTEVNGDLEKILSNHNLNADEYEYMDKISLPERNMIVTFRLFLCSSDYAVEIITLEN